METVIQTGSVGSRAYLASMSPEERRAKRLRIITAHRAVFNILFQSNSLYDDDQQAIDKAIDGVTARLAAPSPYDDKLAVMAAQHAVKTPSAPTGQRTSRQSMFRRFF